MQHFITEVADVLGIIGVILVLLSYLLVNIDKLQMNSFTYAITNFVSALLIIISLLVNWNLSAFLVEVSWALISFYGIFKLIKYKISKNKKDDANSL